MSPRELHSHCPHCGLAFAEPTWPLKCAGCGELTYRNPVPVAAVVLPVDGGLLTVRRAIEPKKGMLTFPGGYVDLGETWQQAAARELREEAGVEIDPDELEPFDVISTSRGHLVMIFGLALPRGSANLPVFVPTAEATECVVIRGPQELAFPQDDAVARRYFRYRVRS